MSRRARRSSFSAVKAEGGLLPDDLLVQVAALDPDLKGLKNPDYHLGEHERIGEEVNRSWTKLLSCWHAHKEAVAAAPEGETTTKETRERWLLPLFKELGYGRLPSGMAIEVDGKKLAVSHGWTNSPVHLLGCRVSLDKRQKGVRGAARTSPHGLVQAFLNRSDDHLWGFVSNGYALRLLRDHHSLTRQAYVEFDLQSIMEGELYSEFMLLWLVCHESRVYAKKPEDCWLEKWFQQAREEGVRALDHLRQGVEAAIKTFGVGFLKHKSNKALREALQSGELDKQDYYRQLLRLVYRLIFIFVAEDRDALLDREGDEKAKQRYEGYYTTKRLRRLAGKRRGSPHRDLWENLRLVMRKLGRGCPELAIPALGSFLWSDEATPWLDQSECNNEHLLAGLRDLCWLRHGKVRYPVNWKNIGADELGSVYESLLELHPRVDTSSGIFGLETLAGNERKTTGSYYTPTSLVECLLDSALSPVLARANGTADPEAAVLALKICDPACGSGHFLVAAARRVAKALASIRSEDAEPAPEIQQRAMRDVVGRCLYGVDVNPMAVELCKVSLWLEAVEGGPPLSFLDNHILCGNSLLGTTPALMSDGIPDDAFKPIEGDDKALAKRLRKRNKEERAGVRDLFTETTAALRLAAVRAEAKCVEGVSDESLDGIRQKEAAWRRLAESPDHLEAQFLADAWCAAFLFPKSATGDEDQAVTHAVFKRLLADSRSAPPGVRQSVRRVSREYSLFHWHLIFPLVFDSEEGGGFDLIIGNPPWERLNLEEKQFFAASYPEIAAAPTSKRKKLIAELRQRDPIADDRYKKAKRLSDGAIHFALTSGRQRMLHQARPNTYLLFAETALGLSAATGLVGLIVPTGIATDTTSKVLFGHLVAEGRIRSLYDFENKYKIFPAVHSSYRFCLLVLSGARQSDPDFAFSLHAVSELESAERHFTIGDSDLKRMSPLTGLCPTFRSKRDMEIVGSSYERFPAFITQEFWSGSDFLIVFRSSNSSHLYKRICPGPETAGYLPVWEAKLLHQFDHRFATYRGSGDSGLVEKVRHSEQDEREPHSSAWPRYWASAEATNAILHRKGWTRQWLLGYRDVARATDERTAIASAMPLGGAAQPLNTFLPETPERARLWLAAFNSFVVDYIARQFTVGIHLNITNCRQLPIPCELGEYGNLVDAAVLELVYTAWDLQPFAEDCGWNGPPFRWDTERRFLLRCELDATFFHLYGIKRDDVDYIMGTFPIVRRKDEKAHGDYRTKIQILDIYDRMQQASDTGEPYKTLDPPPAHPSLAHPPREASKTGKGS
jgi:hypothetical protein